MLILGPWTWLQISFKSKQVQKSLDEDKLYIKIIALDRIYNFVVKKFLNWNYLGSQNIVVSA
jgi:hypothetical protein